MKALSMKEPIWETRAETLWGDLEFEVASHCDPTNLSLSPSLSLSVTATAAGSYVSVAVAVAEATTRMSYLGSEFRLAFRGSRGIGR